MQLKKPFKGRKKTKNLTNFLNGFQRGSGAADTAAKAKKQETNRIKILAKFIL